MSVRSVASGAGKFCRAEWAVGSPAIDFRSECEYYAPKLYLYEAQENSRQMVDTEGGISPTTTLASGLHSRKRVGGGVDVVSLELGVLFVVVTAFVLVVICGFVAALAVKTTLDGGR